MKKKKIMKKKKKTLSKKLKASYDDTAVEKALNDLKNKSTSVRKVASLYNIPRSTLQDIIHGRTLEKNRRKGPIPYLTVEGEEKICEWITDSAACGFPVKVYRLQETVKKIINDAGTKTPFKNNIPGKTWCKLFLTRHPEIKKRVAEGISKGRAVITEEAIRCWFKGLKEFLVKKGCEEILSDPTRIFNGDETAFCLCPKTGKVLAPKGWKNVYEINPGKEKETITFLLFIQASGETVAPMIVYPYTRVPPNIVKSVPESWIIGKSDTGWMKSDVFYEYMANDFNNCLIKNAIKKTVLVFVDGHKTHLTLHLSKFCDENEIILYALLPNCTHILQPADVSVFKPLKSNWKKAVSNWQAEGNNYNKCLTKLEFAPLLHRMVEHTNLSQTIKNGFKACGLFPFNPNNVDYTKCVQNKREALSAKVADPNENSAILVTNQIKDKLEARGIDAIGVIEEICNFFNPTDNKGI